MKFFKQHTLSIEIINARGNLQHVVFRKPKMLKYFSTYSQKDFLSTCERESSSEKILGLLDSFKDFEEEMKHFLFLNSKNLFFNLTYLSWIRNLNLIIIFLINM